MKLEIINNILILKNVLNKLNIDIFNLEFPNGTHIKFTAFSLLNAVYETKDLKISHLNYLYQMYNWILFSYDDIISIKRLLKDNEIEYYTENFNKILNLDMYYNLEDLKILSKSLHEFRKELELHVNDRILI